MKNIGIIVDNEFSKDVRVRKEVDILTRGGYHIHVLCFGFDKNKYSPIHGINVCRIEIKKKKKDVLYFLMNTAPLYESLWQKEVKKFILNNSIDVLHVHDLYMSKSVHLAIQSLKKEIPLILDLHENYPHSIQSYNWTKGVLRGFLSNPRAWLKKEPQYLSYASKLIVLSETFKQDLLKKYKFLDESDIIMFSNVIDLRRFEQFKIEKKKKKSNKVTLMYFGAVAERRGVFETLSVFEKGLKNGLNIELLIIGPLDKADKHRFLNKINQPELKDNISYIPWIDLSELVTYMYISDIFLSPLIKNKQHESGVANKIFQYMYGSKPIIVSDCKPQKNLVDSFNCGLSYSTEEEFLNCIAKLVQDKGLRKTLGANGFKKLYEKYDTVDYENILLSLYKNLEHSKSNGNIQD